MALDQSWILIVCLAIVAATVAVVWFVFKDKKGNLTDKAYFSNTDRLTKLPAYNSLLKEYKLAIGACAGLLALAVALSAVIASKPVEVEAFTPTKYNRDIVLCLDLSGSMYEVDLQIVEKFQLMTEDFKGERIALVVWNSSSNLVFPLTDDYDYISEQLAAVYLF